MIWKPHATVAAIIERDNKFLMVEELIRGEHLFNQPAGHLDPDESLIDAVIRETQEERSCKCQRRRSGQFHMHHSIVKAHLRANQYKPSTDA